MMLEAGRVRYEVEDKGGNENLLHCYIPRDFTPKDVDLSYEIDGISKGRIAIHFDTSFRGKLGCVELDGFVFPEGLEAKFNKKQSRYTFRLIKAEQAASSTTSEDGNSAIEQDIEDTEHFSDAASSIPRSASPADSVSAFDQDDTAAAAAPAPAAAAAAALANGNSNHHMHAQQQHEDSHKQQKFAGQQKASAVDAAADDSALDTADSDQGSAPPPPPAAAEATAAADVSRGDADADHDDQEEEEEDEAEEAAAEGAAKKGKKRRGQRKKKKKKGKTADDDVSTTTDADIAATTTTADSTNSSSTTAAAAAAAAADQDEQEVFLDAISENGDDLLTSDTQQQQQQQRDEQASQLAAADDPAAAAAAAAAPSPRSRPPSAAPPLVFDSDSYASHFTEEPCAGTTELPANAVEVLQLPESLLQGPSIAQCLDTHACKGEDKAMRVVGAKWTPLGSTVGTSFSAFGIFDGHGGKPAATYASKELLPNVMRLVDRCKEGSSSGLVSRQASAAIPGSPAATAAAVSPAADLDGETWGVEVADDDLAVWAAQEALVDRLPKALFAGFLEADKTCRQRHKTSGTTATLAIAVGWELFVANVGDSAAYLDTGKEVIAVSGNHRIDDNPAERARIIAAGGEVSKSCPEGVPVGPDRVWPGGLAMSRTIGDPHAPQVIAVPDIRHVTLPTTGGRLVIASDGVWDHMQPKGMIHQVRNENTEAAAKKIAYAAIKKKGLKDDVSVLVVDFTPAPGDLRPPALLPGPQRDAVEPCQLNRPLMEVEVEAAAVSAGNGKRSTDEVAAALQKQASITAVAAAGGSHWREVAAARRTSALLLMRQQARREAEAAAAEAARLAELAAKAAAESKPAGLSDTYRELAELRLDADAIVAQVQAEQQQQQQQEEEEEVVVATAAATVQDTEGWETVGSSNTADAGGFMPFEQQIQRTAGRGGSRGRGRQQRQQQQQQGDNLGRDHGQRDGRRRERRGGRDSTAAAPADNETHTADIAPADVAHNQQQQQQQQQPHDGGRGGRGFRGFRGRGRSDRSYAAEGSDRRNSSEWPPRRGRGEHAGHSRFQAEQQQQQQQQQQQGPYAGESAGAPAATPVDADGSFSQQQQQQYNGRGRGRGERGGFRGRGFRGGRETGPPPPPPLPAAITADEGEQQQQQQIDHADAAAEPAGSHDQHQQQVRARQPRQQRAYKPAPSAAAASSSDAAAVPDANGSTAAPSVEKSAAPAVRVVQRPGFKPANTAAVAAAADGKGRFRGLCRNCQQPGHYARDCPNSGSTAAAAAAAAAVAAPAPDRPATSAGHEQQFGGNDAVAAAAAATAAVEGGRGGAVHRGRRSGYRGGGRGGRGYERPQQQQQQQQQQEVE